MVSRYRLLLPGAALWLAAATAPPAHALGALDTPAIAGGATGSSKAAITVQAGPSGAPGGFTLRWMKESDFKANAARWLPNGDPRQGQAFFWGSPSLNTHDGAYTTFALGPDQSIEVEVGDLLDESGVTATFPAADVPEGGELDAATTYVFCVFANGTAEAAASEVSPAVTSATRVPDCTRTQGYWKSHVSLWPPASVPMALGASLYTQSQLLQILTTPAAGNGALALAHQLIAAKLNVAYGASARACIAAADLLLSGCGASKLAPLGICSLALTTATSSTQCLDDFNNSRSNNCLTTPAHPATWGRLKTIYR
jgi:hypothetical protein